MADWADEWTASKSEEHMQQILNDRVWRHGRDALQPGGRHRTTTVGRKAGDRFQKKSFFNPLALRRDELRGLHVNTHIPQVIAAARRYEISGDTRFHDVADYFFYEVTHGRTYVTGGTSNGEGWLAQPRRLRRNWKLSVDTAECCCAYNMLKLTRHLYSWNRDPRYFDYYERVAAQSPHRHDPAEDGLHAVLSVADAGRLEDLQHRRPNVLVLHRLGRGRVFEAQRQHLLAR